MARSATIGPPDVAQLGRSAVPDPAQHQGPRLHNTRMESRPRQQQLDPFREQLPPHVKTWARDAARGLQRRRPTPASLAPATAAAASRLILDN
eukprot:5544996-Pyramimonas_sp.AAC.1